MEQRSHIYGVVGEFETPGQIIQAAAKVREAGYRDVEAYTPFPVEGLSEALRLKRSLVPLITLTGGLIGGLGGFGFQYWVAAITYPMNIGGRPLNSWPAFIPVTFELTVLFASISAVLGMLALHKRPQTYHPLSCLARCKKHVSTARFFLSIATTDPKFSVAKASCFLKSVR